MNLRKRCSVYADGEELRDRLPDSVADGRRIVSVFLRTLSRIPFGGWDHALWLCSSEQAKGRRNYKVIA